MPDLSSPGTHTCPLDFQGGIGCPDVNLSTLQALDTNPITPAPPTFFQDLPRKEPSQPHWEALGFPKLYLYLQHPLTESPSWIDPGTVFGFWSTWRGKVSAVSVFWLSLVPWWLLKKYFCVLCRGLSLSYNIPCGTSLILPLSIPVSFAEDCAI